MYCASKVKAVHDLAPEQQKAVATLLSNLPRLSELYLNGQQPNEFCKTGFVAFSGQPFPKLPHDDTWIWNQSNGKVTVQLEGGNFVTLQKLNTRKKKNCPKPPSYKVWMFYLSRSTQQPHFLNFIWCEKGINDSGDNPVPSPLPDFITTPNSIPNSLDFKLFCPPNNQYSVTSNSQNQMITQSLPPTSSLQQPPQTLSSTHQSQSLPSHSTHQENGISSQSHSLQPILHQQNTLPSPTHTNFPSPSLSNPSSSQPSHSPMSMHNLSNSSISMQPLRAPSPPSCQFSLPLSTSNDTKPTIPESKSLILPRNPTLPNPQDYAKLICSQRRASLPAPFPTLAPLTNLPQQQNLTSTFPTLPVPNQFPQHRKRSLPSISDFDNPVKKFKTFENFSPSPLRSSVTLNPINSSFDNQ